MATGLYRWNRDPALNASATYTWAEGMAPSSVNDSARGNMSEVAQWRDDISRGNVTGGTGTAYTLTSFQVFESLALMDRAMVSFIPLVTNTGAVTLNVDGLGAKPLRSGNLAELPAGTLIGGSPYIATYFNSNNEWYVHGYFRNPQSEIPIGAILPYAGATAPNSNFAIPLGQAISRTTFAALFTLIGTTYGGGDGSTTFNLPDLGGRAVFGKEATATRLTTAGGGIDGGTLGAVGGLQNVTLAANQIPAGVPSSNGAQAISVLSTISYIVTDTGVLPSAANTGGPFRQLTSDAAKSAVTSTGSNAISVTSTNASQAAAKTVSPGIVLNNIMRVL